MTLVNDVEENCYDISFSVSARRFLLSKMVFRSILLFAFLYSYSDFDFDSTFYTFVFGRWVFASHLLLYRVCGIVLFAVLAACFSYYSVLNVKCWRVWNSGAIQFVMWTLLSASSIFVFRMFFVVVASLSFAVFNCSSVGFLFVSIFELKLSWCRFRFVEMPRPHLFKGKNLFRVNAPQHKTSFMSVWVKLFHFRENIDGKLQIQRTRAFSPFPLLLILSPALYLSLSPVFFLLIKMFE